MNRENAIKLGSDTAKAGFRNENDIIKKFHDWKTDDEAQKWLSIMDYSIKEIENIEAINCKEKAEMLVAIQQICCNLR